MKGYTSPWKFLLSALATILFAISFLGGLPANAQQAAAQPQTQGAAKFAQARASLDHGETAEALKEVKAGLRLAPRSVAGFNLLGAILLRQERRAEALAAFQAALKIDARSPETHNNLGDFYERDGKLDLAEQEFRSTLQTRPLDPTANYNLGALELLRGDAAAALPYLRRVQPADQRTQVALVEADIQLHQNQKALALARSLSSQSPQDAHLHFSLGTVLASGREYALAIHEFELADALKPGDFQTLRQLGNAYLDASEYQKAEAALNHALKTAPDSVDALYLQAEVYSHEKKTIDAFQLLFKARKLAPRNTDVIYLLARLSMNLAYYSDAIPLLEEGVKIAPRQADLHAALGECYYGAGKIQQAFDEFSQLVQLDPSASSYAFMGLFYLHQGQFGKAQESFKSGLEKHPGDPQCLYNLGYIADKQGNFEQGEQYLEEALKSKPDYDDALYELASSKITRGEFAPAAALLERCVRIDPNKARTYYKLAAAERGLHQTAAAGRDLKVFQTLARNPAPMPMPFQDFFASVEEKTSLSPEQQAESDLRGLQESVAQHPDEPRLVYLLAETYLKLGRPSDGEAELAKLRRLSGGDERTLTGAGVLLARYRLFPQAVEYFQSALAANPKSDDARYDLADAYFQTRDYEHALQTLQQMSPAERNDPAALSLLGDTEMRLGRLNEAEAALNQAIQLSPDDDRHYLSLALAEILSGNLAGAQQTLAAGKSRIPDSGRMAWGAGVLCVMEGDNQQAEREFEQAVSLMPQWESSYSALGTFYFDTGQVSKAQQTLDRYAELFPHGLLNVNQLRRVLTDAQAQPREDSARPLSPQEKSQFLAMAMAFEGLNP